MRAAGIIDGRGVVAANRRWRVGAVASLLGAIPGMLALILCRGLMAMEVTPCGDYMLACWKTEDGLPQSSVPAMARTPDGYLWLATFNGLTRFDGVRFVVFDTTNLPGLPDNRITRLLATPEGALWLITEAGQVARLAEGVCRSFGVPDGLPVAGVRGLAAADDGTVWVAGRRKGLWRLERDRFIETELPGGMEEWPIHSIVPAVQEGFWINHRVGVYRWRGGEWSPVTEDRGSPPRGVEALCRGGGENLFAVGREGMWRRVAGAWQSVVASCPDFGLTVTAFAGDGEGTLWVATYDQGLFRFDAADGWRHFTVGNGLPTRSLRSLYADPEGNLWVGTDGEGLLRLRPRPWRTLTRRDGLGIDAVHSVAEDSAGRVWLVGGTSQPFWVENGAVSPAKVPVASLPPQTVWGVLAARDGTVWIGTYHGHVNRIRDGQLTHFGEARGVDVGTVRALLEDGDGAVWVGGTRGLFRIFNEEVTGFREADGMSSEVVTALAADAHGRLYVGTLDGGLNRLEDGRFTVFGREDGLPNQRITALHLDAAGVLWVGTHRGGLTRFEDGRFFGYQACRDLATLTPVSLLEDDCGWLWMGSSRGIARISKAALQAFAGDCTRRLDLQMFDRTDGLESMECSSIQPGSCRTADGTLWFGTARGAACVHPARVPSRSVSPRVLVEEVRVDDRVAWVNRTPSRPGAAGAEKRVITVEPGLHRIEFHYTGLSLTASERIRFRCLLEGSEPGWTDVGPLRVANYTGLAPGRYAFRVIAGNDSGVWSDPGDEFGLIVRAPWYQTRWFLALAILLAGAVVVWFYERRVQRLRKTRALQEGFSRRLLESQEAERKRLAGELHDGLGQDLLLIKNRAVLAREAPDAGRHAVAEVEKIAEAATRAIDSVRAMAHVLRPYELDRLGLAGAIESMNDRVAGTTGLVFHSRLEDPDSRLTGEQRTMIYRILQEGLNNIVKHAGATEVFLELHVEDHHLTLRLQDDGRGFAPIEEGAEQTGDGQGLAGIRERARLLGADLRIQSAPGMGTVLTLNLPLQPGKLGVSCSRPS